MKPAKRKTIKKVLHAKVEDWAITLPEHLQKMVREGTIVTGGSIVSLLRGERINDFDLYFTEQETALAIAQHYANWMNEEDDLDIEVRIEPGINIRGEEEERIINYVSSAGVAEGESDQEPDETEEWLNGEAPEDEPKKQTRYRPVFISRNAITLSDSVQLITRFYGDAEQVHKSFDFIHATCWYDVGKNELVLPGPALESILSNTLYYQGSLYPIASIFRAKKFIERGWRISAGDLLKIMWQISELDLTDTRLLTDQLTGVDALYMSALVHALQDANEDRLGSDYVIGIIDRIFNT